MTNENCSDEELDLPVTSDYYDALYNSQKAMIFVSAGITVITFILAIKVSATLSRTHGPEMKQMRISALWMVALCPLLSLISMMSMVVPRTFLFRDVLMTGALAVTLYKFVHHIKACLRYIGKEHEAFSPPARLTFTVPPCCCCCKCLPTTPVSPKNINILKGILLQYSFVGTIIAILVMCLWLNEKYDLGDNKSSNAYPFLMVVKVVSTLSAIFSLGVLYALCAKVAEGFYIGEKYAGLKLILLCVNVQDPIFSILLSADVFEDRDCLKAVVFSNYVQDVAFVIEMFLISLIHFRAYQKPLDIVAAMENQPGLQGHSPKSGSKGRSDSHPAAYYNDGVRHMDINVVSQ